MIAKIYADLLQELHALYAEARIFPLKPSSEQVDLISRIDNFYSKLKHIPLCGNLSAQQFKGQLLGGKQERASIYLEVTSAISTYAFDCLKQEVDR